MTESNNDLFLKSWPKCFIRFTAIIELITVLILFVTEFGNVGANFWTTNVFAGGWCGLVLLIHVIFVFKAGCCSPGVKPAFRAFIIAIIGLVATAALISFDSLFIARPTTCILTPSCVENSASNTTFSYSFRQSFFTIFNSWGPFKSYSESSVKFLCHTIQVGVGGLCFLLCLIYIIIYRVTSNKSKQTVGPGPSSNSRPYYGQTPPPMAERGYYPSPPPPPVQQSYYPSAPPPPFQQNYYPPPPAGPQGYFPDVPRQQFQQPVPAGWRPQPRVPQAQPGVIPWNSNGGY